MSFIRLDITNFRNLNAVKIEPALDGLTCFYGNNGSGKTSLLEAIYYLSRGRSFRSTAAQHLIRHSTEKFSIFGELKIHSHYTLPIGMERSRQGELHIRAGGQDNVLLANLVEWAPTLLINSHSFNLLDAGPIFRRKYLDWGSFYLAPEFLSVWKQYERKLKQRNAALRARANRKEIKTWSSELAKSASHLNAFREEFVRQLLPCLQATLSTLIDLSELNLDYYRGWNNGLSYQEAMEKNIDNDLALGYTQLGPHRADFKISIRHIPTKDILSRGQQKLFICAMIAAQGMMLQQCANKNPIYLIDDLPAELDRDSRSKLISLLMKQQAQVFLTAIEPQALADSVPMKMFHVEHGEVKAVSTERS